MQAWLKVGGALCLLGVVGWLNVAASESPSKSTSVQLESSKTGVETTAPVESSTMVSIDFDEQSAATQWRTVNDTVMGGISQSTFRITPEDTGVFSGDLSLENNGGFSSVRRELAQADFADAEGIRIRVKGDGRRYQLRLRMNSAENAVSYRAEFAPGNGSWTTVWLPLSDFEPVFRGRIIEDAPALAPEEISEIGFLLADKRPGEFELEIDWIRAE